VPGYLFYGLDTSGPPKVAGVVSFGSGYTCGSVDPTGARNGRMYSRGESDPNWPLVYVHVALDPAVPSLSGSLRRLDEPQQTRQLTGGLIPGSTFDVKVKPNLIDIVGGWTMVDPLGNPSAFAIANDGKLTGTYRGCTVDGAVQPSVDGSNLFAVQLRAKPCMALYYLQDSVGFAVAIPLAAGGTQLLLWAEANNGVAWSYVLAVGQ